MTRFSDLAERRLLGELMDDPALPPDEHQQALAGLGRVNRFTFVAPRLWRVLRSILGRRRDRPVRPLRLLDLATGGGDVPIELARLAKRRGVPLEVAGCDRSATAVEWAREQAARAGVEIRFFKLDVLREALPHGFDILTCSLFLHHLERSDAVRLLASMREVAAEAIIANDLLRSYRGLALTYLGTRTLTRSLVVHTDGLLSVRAAFTLAEARELAADAGLDGARFRRIFPCRFELLWRKSRA